MEIQDQASGIESVTMSDILNLTPTWDRARTTDELIGFVARRRAEVEDIDLDED